MAKCLPVTGSAAEPPEVFIESAVASRCRLFVGNLPKAKTEKELGDEVSRITGGLVRVITYKNFRDPAMHRGFCFLDYETTEAAAEAKRRLTRYKMFGCKTVVDWADPEPEADDETMAAVRILFVRQYGGVLDETTLTRVFGRYGTVERVKNLKNYSFVHFALRRDAEAARNALDGTAVDADSGVELDVSWAKPPVDKQTKERVLRNRERRNAMQQQTTAAAVNKTLCPLATHCARSDPAAGATSDPSPPPYSTYDHYEYDFNWQTLGCACQPVKCVSQQTRCCRRGSYCPCAVAVAAAAAAAVSSDNCVDFNGDDVQMQPQRRQPANAAGRHDRGDCAVNSNVDANVLKFFYNVRYG